MAGKDSIDPKFDAQAEEEQGEIKPQQLLAELDRHWGGVCPGCSKPICGHEILFSNAMGFKDQPRCVHCLAEVVSQSVLDLRNRLIEYIHHRDCYRQAWEAASIREGQAAGKYPICLGEEQTQALVPSGDNQAESQGSKGDSLTWVDSWDAGTMSCGDLVLALRIRLNNLPEGTVIKVTALDPAAPEDLPAWCRLTGHRLLQAHHPTYLIQRKGN